MELTHVALRFNRINQVSCVNIDDFRFHFVAIKLGVEVFSNGVSGIFVILLHKVDHLILTVAQFS